ncbi:MAG: class I SAM-dependent methyltransferase [Ruminococcus sp.]|nr:class I SAM-dependent methyltransferase [Ruminococcus sp.]
MQKVKLDSRLLSVATLCRNGSRLLDIGTDHAYLPAYLVQNGVCPSAIAADVREMPLQNAKETIDEYGLGDKIKTVLSNGLDNIGPNSADDIVLAGMGGILIEEILSRAEWIKTKSIRIIAQPMTHPERVRSFFINHGFHIIDEAASSDSKHNYCAIAAEYVGENQIVSEGYIYFGELKNKKDEDAKKYLKKQLERLKKRRNALTDAGTCAEECKQLGRIIEDFEKQTEVTNND